MSTKRTRHTGFSWMLLMGVVGCATATVDDAGDGDSNEITDGDGGTVGDGGTSSGGVILSTGSGGRPMTGGSNGDGDGDGDDGTGGVVIGGDGDGDTGGALGDGDGDTGGAMMGDGDGDTGGSLATGGAGSGGSASGGASSGGAASNTTGGASSGGSVGAGDCEGVDFFELGTGSEYAQGDTVVATCSGGTPCAGLEDGEDYEFTCLDQYNCGSQDPGTTNWSVPPWEVVQACN